MDGMECLSLLNARQREGSVPCSPATPDTDDLDPVVVPASFGLPGPNGHRVAGELVITSAGLLWRWGGGHVLLPGGSPQLLGQFETLRRPAGLLYLLGESRSAGEKFPGGGRALIRPRCCQHRGWGEVDQDVTRSWTCWPVVSLAWSLGRLPTAL